MRRLANVLAAIVLLTTGYLLGLNARFAPASAFQGNCRTFAETGKQVCGRFLEYWQGNGGLAQQGLPLSNEFTEVSDLNGQPYVVQYFERAVFEKHPENRPPFDVLLSQLGTFQFKRKYPNGEPTGGPQATVTPRPAGTEFEQIGTPFTYRDSFDDLIVVGALKYNGATDRGSPEVVVTLSDAAGKVLATDSSSTGIRYLKPGGLIPYRVDLGDTPDGWARIEVDVVADPASDFEKESVHRDLVVEQPNIIPPPEEGDELRILGRVRNSGSKAASSVSITAIIYDARGRVIEVTDGFTELDVIPPGGTSPFELTTYYAPRSAR
jgi:hypothetical protein